VVTHQLQVKCRTGKVRRPETDVLPLSHATNVGVTPVEFQGDVWHQKTRFPGLSCDVVYVILGLAVLAVVKLLSKRWWIAIGARLEGSKLEPEGPRAEVGFPTADQGFSSIQALCLAFMAFK